MLFTEEKCHESSDVVISKFIRVTSWFFTYSVHSPSSIPTKNIDRNIFSLHFELVEVFERGWKSNS